MFIGIIVLVLGLAFLIIDGIRTPKWQMARAIGRWLNNRIVRRILRILSVLAATVGSLFIISTLGFIAQGIPGLPENAKNWLMWLTLLPVAIAMIVIWVMLASGAVLEKMAQAFAKALGFKVDPKTDPKILAEWEKGFLTVMFWTYLVLAFYPFWNPWTGNLSPELMVGLLFGGLALTVYARWAAGAGKKSKIFGLIVVPLLFMYCLGAKYPDKFSFLGSLVGWMHSTTGLEQAKRDQSSVVKDRKAEAIDENTEFLRNTREVQCVHEGPLYTVENGTIKKVAWQPAKNEIVRAASIINKDLDGNEVPEIIKKHFIDPKQQFKLIYGPDSDGRFTKGTSKKGWAPAEDFPPYIRVRKNFEYTDDNKSSNSAGQREVVVTAMLQPNSRWLDWQPTRGDKKMHEGLDLLVKAPVELENLNWLWGFNDNVGYRLNTSARIPKNVKNIYLEGPQHKGGRPLPIEIIY